MAVGQSLPDPLWYLTAYDQLGEDFLLLDWAKDTEREVAFVVKALGLQPGARILDLGAGIGRHALGLAARGFQVTAIDIGERLVEFGRRLAAERNLEVLFVHGDYRDYQGPAEFDAAISMAGGPLGCFESDTDNDTFFSFLRRMLRPGRRCLIDTVNLQAVARRCPCRSWSLDQNVLQLQELSYDSWSGRLNSVEHVRVLSVDKEYVLRTTVRLYSLAELRYHLERNDMAVTALYGDYDVEVAWDCYDWDLLLIATKNR